MYASTLRENARQGAKSRKKETWRQEVDTGGGGDLYAAVREKLAV